MALRRPHRGENPTTVPPLTYYYDAHPTREDLMGESYVQALVIQYLLQVLQYYLKEEEGWLVTTNLNIYNTPDYMEYPVAPDIAVFKGMKLDPKVKLALRSWKMLEAERPAPAIVFEICSHDTFRDDLKEKPGRYGQLGVQEYFLFDPNDPPLWRKYGPRLQGWRYTSGEPVRLVEDEQGRLWSETLQSWLTPASPYLRLFDREGQQRLTGEEAERSAREAERVAREKAWNRLRELGIDPETL